jgi:hypothetical protein
MKTRAADSHGAVANAHGNMMQPVNFFKSLPLIAGGGTGPPGFLPLSRPP